MKAFKFQPHYLTGSDLINTVNILIENKFRISLRYSPRLLSVLLADLLLTPFHLADQFLFKRKVSRVEISASPIFIIGHWRSGTTYMHNLLCLDEQFAFPSTYQCLMPGLFLSGGKFMKGFLKLALPETRPVDHARLDADFPQEEEFALNALSIQSYYQALCFPHHIKGHFNKYAKLDADNKERWKKEHHWFLKKVSFVNPGKTLICKNPTNTVRIQTLLELYPDARFIYLERNKTEVLTSAFNLYKELVSMYTFQRINSHEIKDNVTWIYERTMREYQNQRELIPPSQLLEIAYDELVSSPMLQLEKIYAHFKIDGLEKNRSIFNNYIRDQSSHRINNNARQAIETNQSPANLFQS